MKFGLTPDQYQFIFETVVLPLRKLGATIWIYGSRARGDHTPFSDLDIMIVSEKDLSFILSEMREKLSQSNFPYKVDLVSFEEFAESYKGQFEKDKAPFGSP